MKKRIYFIHLVILSILCFSACSEKQEGPDMSALLDIYGRQYSLTEGVLWKNNPDLVVSKVPYVYEDTYTDEEGNLVTDRVTGFTAGQEVRKVGNFMLSLYEEGLYYQEELKAVSGKGACICFHLSSETTEELKAGRYVCKTGKEPGTFVAYSSSEYDSENKIVPAEISEGEIVIEREGENYSVTFDCRTSFGGEVKGAYRGKIHDCRVPQLPSAYYENLALAGLLDTVVVTETWVGWDPWIGTSFDIGNGTAFLASGSGSCKFAKDGGKELIDVALVWDKHKEAFYFESPLRMRSLLGHDDAYNFPCHTVYMRAPDSFTDSDFEHLEENDFSFDIIEEKVEFMTDNFKPGYVFFRTGNGMEGVIRVKGFAPYSIVTNIGWGGELISTKPVNAVLYIDVKCPANFVNPKIR